MNEPIKPLSEENRARLRVIAEKLKGEELFPKSIFEKAANSNPHTLKPDVPTEKIFTEDTRLFRDEVKIISEKIADFLAQERKILSDRIKHKKNNPLK